MNRFFSTGGPMTLVVDGPQTPLGWKVDVVVSVREGFTVTLGGRNESGDSSLSFQRRKEEATQEIRLVGDEAIAGTYPFNGWIVHDVTFYVPRADCYKLHATWTGPTSGAETEEIAVGATQ